MSVGITATVSMGNILLDSSQDILGGIWRVKRSVTMSLVTDKAGQIQLFVNIEGLLVEVDRLIQAPVVAVTVSEGLQFNGETYPPD